MLLAFAILLNIMVFAVATFGTSLLIEKYYHGRLKWIIVPLFTFISAAVLMRTDFVPGVLYALTKVFTVQDFGLILLGGMIAGVFFSFL